MLVSDNGRKYELIKFNEFCVVNEIHMKETINGTLQQIGVTEYMNRTLNVLGRYIRLHTRLPKMSELMQSIL